MEIERTPKNVFLSLNTPNYPFEPEHYLFRNEPAAKVLAKWKVVALSNGAASDSDADVRRWLCQQVRKLDRKKAQLTYRLLDKELDWLRELSKLTKAHCLLAARFPTSERERVTNLIGGISVIIFAGLLWGSFKGLKWVWRRERGLWSRHPREDGRDMGGEDAEAGGGRGTTQQL